jgi:hypothetical protein
LRHDVADAQRLLAADMGSSLVGLFGLSHLCMHAAAVSASTEWKKWLYQLRLLNS